MIEVTYVRDESEHQPCRVSVLAVTIWAIVLLAGGALFGFGWSELQINSPDPLPGLGLVLGGFMFLIGALGLLITWGGKNYDAER